MPHSETQLNISLGSTKIEMGSSVSDLVNFGLAQNTKFVDRKEFNKFKPDNAEEIKNILDRVITLEFKNVDIDLKNLNFIRTLTPV